MGKERNKTIFHLYLKCLSKELRMEVGTSWTKGRSCWVLVQWEPRRDQRGLKAPFCPSHSPGCWKAKPGEGWVVCT